jgi:5-formyltetrahydrofolate cyclo-ligase
VTSEPIIAAKKQLRAEILTRRAELDPTRLAETAEQFADQLDAFAADHHATTVTAYASVGTEPGTRLAIERLRARGVRVLLPIVLPDLDLDWAEYTPGEWHDRRMGLVEPTSRPLGINAIGEADVIFCPGVAGSLVGARLGRGGGCYDRALTRARPDAVRCLVLYDENVFDEVPSTGDDQRVNVILTPTRVIDVRQS